MKIGKIPEPAKWFENKQIGRIIKQEAITYT